MKDKKYLICLACGTVQVRTDIEKIMDNKYKLLKNNYRCPYCNKETSHVATNNIHILEKTLVPKNNMDKRVLSLIGR